ncbi:MAG: hypothetical protein ACW990_16845, partial [Promethearchaeota archaeon]
KNKGNSKKIIERLNNLGIITYHNYIIGLPFHTKKTINLEIKNNLEYDSDLIAVNNFKPIPNTLLYRELGLENRLYHKFIPPEFFYASGFLPFDHKYIGGGFEILKYFFKAVYECEKKTIDINDKFANKLLDLYSITSSRKIEKAAEAFLALSRANFSSFYERMPFRLTRIFDKRIKATSQRYKNMKKFKIV